MDGFLCFGDATNIYEHESYAEVTLMLPTTLHLHANLVRQSLTTPAYPQRRWDVGNN